MLIYFLCSQQNITHDLEASLSINWPECLSNEKTSVKTVKGPKSPDLL